LIQDEDAWPDLRPRWARTAPEEESPGKKSSAGRNGLGKCVSEFLTLWPVAGGKASAGLDGPEECLWLSLSFCNPKRVVKRLVVMDRRSLRALLTLWRSWRVRVAVVAVAVTSNMICGGGVASAIVMVRTQC
jgi:hypothetical protein